MRILDCILPGRNLQEKMENAARGFGCIMISVLGALWAALTFVIYIMCFVMNDQTTPLWQRWCKRLLFVALYLIATRILYDYYRELWRKYHKKTMSPDEKHLDRSL